MTDKMPKLTPAMKREILNLAAGRGPGYGLRGMSAHGGLNGTRHALVRHGLIGMDWELTDAGREAARKLAHPRPPSSRGR